MNHVKLVEMMKTVTKEKFLNEATHGTRYGRAIGGKTSNLKLRYKPDNPQLAEDDDNKVVRSKTLTGGEVEVNLNPKQSSQMAPTTGPTRSTA